MVFSDSSEGPHVCGRLVAAAGGAGALPREGGGVRRRCPAPQRRPPGRRFLHDLLVFPLLRRPGPWRLAAPAGFRLASSSELVTGSALVGRAVLLRWPGPMAGFAGTALYGRGVLAFGPVRSAVGAGRCGGRLAARCRLARLGGPVDPALSAA